MAAVAADESVSLSVKYYVICMTVRVLAGGLMYCDTLMLCSLFTRLPL